MPKVVDEIGVFKAVVEMFALHGYEGATTKEVAQAAGINEATLFRKYGSKAELFEKAIQHQLADTPLNRLIYTGDLDADLLAIVDAYLETNDIHGEIIPAILAEVPRQPELKGSLCTPWENIQPAIKILQAYQMQGLLKDDSPFSCLNALIGPLMTSQMFRRADPGFPVAIIDPSEHVKAFLHGRKQG
jgi:AcrR family transcriptional regulator